MKAQRGAVAVEFALLVPVLVLLASVAVGSVRLWFTTSSVQQWADSAARQAALARTASEASARAHRIVHDDAVRFERFCIDEPKVVEDTSGFAAPLGVGAVVRVEVRCEVRYSDVFLPGVPGRHLVVARAESTLDRYRGR